MISDPSEAVIDQIVATCNGDIRGALKALLMVNEQLEAELQQLYAAVALGGRRARQQRSSLVVGRISFAGAHQRARIHPGSLKSIYRSIRYRAPRPFQSGS